MKIAERTAVWRQDRRVLLRVSRAAWRLEQAGRYQRGETSQRPGYTDNPFRPR